MCGFASGFKNHEDKRGRGEGRRGAGWRGAYFKLAGYYVFNANISLTFQAIKNPYVHLTYLCFGPVGKFFGDF